MERFMLGSLWRYMRHAFVNHPTFDHGEGREAEWHPGDPLLELPSVEVGAPRSIYNEVAEPQIEKYEFGELYHKGNRHVSIGRSFKLIPSNGKKLNQINSRIDLRCRILQSFRRCWHFEPEN